MSSLGLFQQARTVLHDAQRILSQDERRAPIALGEVLVSLGVLYQQLGDFPRAFRSLVRSRAIFERHLDPGHPTLQLAEAQWALSEMQAGSFDQALMRANSALALARSEPISCRSTLGSMGSIAFVGVLLDGQQNTQAERVLRLIFDKTTCPANQYGSTVHILLARAIRRQGRMAEASHWFELATIESAQRFANSGSLFDRGNLAMSLLGLGEVTEARPHVEALLATGFYDRVLFQMCRENGIEPEDYRPAWVKELIAAGPSLPAPLPEGEGGSIAQAGR